MWFNRHKNACMKQMIKDLFLFWIFFSLSIPSSMAAQDIVIDDQEIDQRAKTAYLLTGATIIGVAGIGIAYAATSSNRHCRHSHSCYSSSSSCHSSSYSSCSSSSHSSSHYSRSCDSSYSSGYYYSNPYSIFSQNNVSSWSDGGGVFVNNLQNPQLRYRKSKDLRRDSKEENSLSGSFIVNPAAVVEGQGGMTAFVQLPNGTKQILGHLVLSGKTSSSVSYGPFNEVGTYTFGVMMDAGTVLPYQTKVGSVEIEENETKIQSYDFIVPAYPPPHFEPSPYFYHYKNLYDS